MIAMVDDPHMAPDQFGDSQRRPELRAVAVCHRPLEKQTNQSFLLPWRQPTRSARRGLGLERIGASFSHGIAPSHHAAGVATDPASNFMQRQVLLDERDGPSATLLQRLGRAVRSHGDTSLRDVSSILHYLCGCQ